jgi:Type IV secretion-system coupling protein DNA-binding domain
MLGSARSVAGSALWALKLTGSQEGAPFSVRRWLREGSGVLFMPYRAEEIGALRTMICAWMRLAIFEAMDGPEGDQRLWFIVDELDALGAIDGLKDALARVRKFGGRCVLGLQAIEQVASIYGPGVAQTFLAHTGNTLILRCPASEQGGTAEYASHLMGRQQILSRILPRRYRAWLSKLATQHPVPGQSHGESDVLPSHIERLPDFEGFLKLASHPDWRYARLNPSEAAVKRARLAPTGQVHPATVAEPADKPQGGPAEPPVPPVSDRSEAPARRRARRRKTLAPESLVNTATAPTPDKGFAAPAAAALPQVPGAPDSAAGPQPSVPSQPLSLSGRDGLNGLASNGSLPAEAGHGDERDEPDEPGEPQI